MDMEIERRFIDWRKAFLAIILMSTPLPTQEQKKTFIELIKKQDDVLQCAEFEKVSKLSNVLCFDN